MRDERWLRLALAHPIMCSAGAGTAEWEFRVVGGGWRIRPNTAIRGHKTKHGSRRPLQPRAMAPTLDEDVESTIVVLAQELAGVEEALHADPGNADLATASFLSCCWVAAGWPPRPTSWPDAPPGVPPPHQVKSQLELALAEAREAQAALVEPDASQGCASAPVICDVDEPGDEAVSSSQGGPFGGVSWAECVSHTPPHPHPSIHPCPCQLRHACSHARLIMARQACSHAHHFGAV
jgi:hypothetical protein